MALRNRKTIKNFFRKGTIPTESSFEDMVDSMVNIIDDGFLKNSDEGLMLSPTGDSDRLVTFYKNIEFKNPAWSFELGPDKDASGFNIKDQQQETRFFIHPSGNVGIDTVKPRARLEVNGFVGSDGRLGTHHIGEVDAKGSWQDLLKDIKGCVALEIVARAGGKQGAGKYALMHCIAITTYGNSRQKIKKVQAYYGGFWHKMAIRWKEYKNSDNTTGIGLQIKTRSNYGEGSKIRFHITKLWDDHDMDALFTAKK